MKLNSFANVAPNNSAAIFGAALPNGKTALKSVKNGKITFVDSALVTPSPHSNEALLSAMEKAGKEPQWWTQEEIEKVIAENPASVAELPAPPAEIVIAPAAEKKIEVVEVVNELPKRRGNGRKEEPLEHVRQAMQGVIGQERCKEALMAKANQAIQTGIFPILPFYDAPGLGKTHILTVFGEALAEAMGCIFFTLNLKGKMNCTSEIFKDFCDVFAEALSTSDPETRVIILLDEFASNEARGSAPPLVRAMLSQIPDGKAVSIYNHEAMAFNAGRVGLLLASYQNPDMTIREDTFSRYPQPSEFQLSLYSTSELMEILKIDIKAESARNGVHAPKVSEAFLRRIARAMRGNARESSILVAPKIVTMLTNGVANFTIDHATTVIRDCGLAPWGLNKSELLVLRHLTRRADTVTPLKDAGGIPGKFWPKVRTFLEYGTGDGSAFQLEKGGEPIEGANGPLIKQDGAKYSLTAHGINVVHILKRDNWIPA